jgi:hypothetical protein
MAPVCLPCQSSPAAGAGGQDVSTRIEQLIDEVCFDANGPAKNMRNEHLGERWFLMDHAENGGFL